MFSIFPTKRGNTLGVRGLAKNRSEENQTFNFTEGTRSSLIDTTMSPLNLKNLEKPLKMTILSHRRMPLPDHARRYAFVCGQVDASVCAARTLRRGR